jgi:YesN/AraC family two-component response regulator
MQKLKDIYDKLLGRRSADDDDTMHESSEMNTRFVITTLFMVVVVGTCLTLLFCNSFGTQNNSQALNELKLKGNKYIEAGQTDSAMACYAKICNSYNEDMTDEEKDICSRAYNNEGYIYFFFYNNNLQAYSCFLKALNINNKLKDQSFKPRIYLNIGNIFYNYDDNNRAIAYSREAFYAAIKYKDWESLFLAFSNLIEQGCTSKAFNLDTLKPELQAFSKLKYPEGTMSMYATHIYRGTCYLIDKQFKEAINEFETAEKHINIKMFPERDVTRISLIEAHAYEMENRYDLAVHASQHALDLIKGSKNYDILSSIYGNMVYYYDKMGMKDSSVACKVKAFDISKDHFDAKRYGAVRDMKSMYELKAKDEQMAELKMKKKTQTTVSYVVFIGSVIIIILLVILYSKKKRQYQLIADLYQKAIDTMNTDANEKRYKASTLESDKKNELLEKIRDVMINNKEVYQPDFTFERLVQLVDDRARYVSQVINELCGKSFNNLLGEYRVKEACRRLVDEEHYGQLSLEGVALSVGFKSRTNFVKVFKNETGLTPSEFHKMSLKSDK